MKNFVKVCLIVCLALACIGGICMCVGAALGSGPREVMQMMENNDLHIGNLHIGAWNVFFSDDEEYDEGEVVKGMLAERFLASDVSSLDIDIKYGEVYLSTSKSDQIEINIDAPERNRYQCSYDDGTIELKDVTTGWNLWNHKGITEHHVTVRIAIPEGKVFDEIELCTNAGKVEISHSLSANEISLELDAGELKAESMTASDEISADIGAGRLEISQFAVDTLEIDCGMGEAVLCGQVLGDADIKCGMGRIDLTLLAAESAYDYELSCGLGSISLNGQDYTSLGRKKSIKNNTGNEIILDCGLGEINVSSKEE